MDLFDQPISRASDPYTSHRAGVQHTKRGERARQVLALMERFPGSTTGELSRRMLEAYPKLPFATCAESPHKRAADLEAKGWACKGPVRVCADTGRERLTWYITEAGHRELAGTKKPPEGGFDA